MLARPASLTVIEDCVVGEVVESLRVVECGNVLVRMFVIACESDMGTVNEKLSGV